MPQDYIFLPEHLPALKRAYNKALKDNKETFTFKGAELLTKYAKYLIEYMTGLK